MFLQLADGKLVELHVAAEKMREIPIKPIKTHYIPCYPMLSLHFGWLESCLIFHFGQSYLQFRSLNPTGPVRSLFFGVAEMV